MKQPIIVLDSSVSQKTKDSKLGPASCLWAAFIYEPTSDKHPLSKEIEEKDRFRSSILLEGTNPESMRSGAIYNNHDSPTRIFYDGIIRAMESCFYLLKMHAVNEVVVIGDSEIVIEQLNNRRKVVTMGPMYNQVKKFETAEYSKMPVRYEYVSEDDYSLYKKLDGMCKQVRGILEKI